MSKMKEALKVLDMFLHKQCDLERTRFAHTPEEVWQAVQTARDSLQKQIPKKPYRMETFIRLQFCPICNTYVCRDQIYCDKCGHKLDWSE